MVDVADHHRGAPAGDGREKKPWHGRPNETFRQKIAEAERSAEHENDGAWSDVAREHEVDSDSAFLANPAAQEEAMTAYMDRNEAQLKANESKSHIGMEYRDHKGKRLKITGSGLAAAAHRERAGATARTLEKLQTKAAGRRRTFRKEEVRAIKRMRDFEGVPAHQPYYREFNEALLKRQVYWAEFDLDGDGVAERFAILEFSGMCGSIGCSTTIFKFGPKGWELAGEIGADRDSLWILPEIDNGWRRINTGTVFYRFPCGYL